MPPQITALHSFFDQELFRPLQRFLTPLLIYRPYKSVDECNEWFLKSQGKDFQGLVKHRAASFLPEKINNPLGGLEILPCGWVDTATLAREMKQVLQDTGNFRCLDEVFLPKQLDPEKRLFHPTGETFDEVIFCEGPRVSENPWFSHLNLAPLKGQVLEIEVEGLPEDLVVLRKVFLVPRGDNKFVVGSTYEKNFSHLDPTPEGINTLENYIGEAIRLPFRRIDVRAGARLTTPNRRPVAGRHPDYPGLIIFNGLGTKGVLQAPWTARHLRHWLDGHVPVLLKDIRLERFSS